MQTLMAERKSHMEDRALLYLWSVPIPISETIGMGLWTPEVPNFTQKFETFQTLSASKGLKSWKV